MFQKVQKISSERYWLLIQPKDWLSLRCMIILSWRVKDQNTFQLMRIFHFKQSIWAASFQSKWFCRPEDRAPASLSLALECFKELLLDEQGRFSEDIKFLTDGKPVEKGSCWKEKDSFQTIDKGHFFEDKPSTPQPNAELGESRGDGWGSCWLFNQVWGWVLFEQWGHWSVLQRFLHSSHQQRQKICLCGWPCSKGYFWRVHLG